MEPSDPLQDVLVDAVKPLQVELGVVDVQGQLLHFAALCDCDSAPIEKGTPACHGGELLAMVSVD
jgi:hypothetical protein